MNLFEYKARVKELEMCKLVKDLEAFVRRYNSKLNKYYRISLEDKYYYKLYALSLNYLKLNLIKNYQILYILIIREHNKVYLLVYLRHT